MKLQNLLKKVFTACFCLIVLYHHASAQTSPVKGKVLDSKGIPVPGATIRIKGSTKGTASSADGSFAISVPPGAVLVISAVGYNPQEVPAKNNITLTLTDNSQTLTDVVVTALGVKREKRNLTYSSQQIKSDEINQAKDPNLINAIDGKVAGVQVTTSSGTPGSSSRIVIRGASSFYGDNQALMVVDGVPINNDETGNLNSGPGSNRLVDIDPSIIESMDVLKGAAATALYGSSGANGVIIITTKNGNKNKAASVNFSSDYSFENALFPKVQNKYSQGLNGQYYDGVNQKTSTSWGALMDTLKINGQKAPVYNQLKEFFRTGTTRNNTVSVNGGSNTSSYFMSYGNYYQKGTVPATDFLRNTFFVKYANQITKDVNTTFQLDYSNSQNNRLPEGYALESPVWTIYTAPVSYNLLPYLDANGNQRLYRYSRNNPYWVVANIYNKSGVNRFLPTFTTDYKPFGWLTLTERFGADVYTETDKYREAVGSAANPNGRIIDQNINFRQFNNDLFLKGTKKFGDFDIDVLLGNNIYSKYKQYQYAVGKGLTIADFENISSASNITYGESHYLTRKIGFYAQSNIDYKRFLILSLTGRYDGSSVLSKDKSFYPYGSAATSFILSDFFSEKLQDVMNLAKFRVSYATVGNDGVDPYSLTTPYGSVGVGNISFPYNGQAGFLINGVLGNPYLRNERINEFETGFEAGFFKNRITLEASYFQKRTTSGIIPGVTIAPSTGYYGTTVNTGEMRNSGIEVLLGGKPVRSKNFSWDMTINFSRIRNKVLSIDGDLPQIGNGFTTIIKGQPYGTIFGTRYARTASGQLRIGADGLPYADATQGIIGDINPTWTGGITNNFRYKQFNVSFFFDVKKGGDIQNNVDGYGYFYGTPKVTEDRGPRVVQGISDVTGQPNTVAVSGQSYYQRINGITESVIQDGTYIKLRNASIGYTFKPAWLIHTPFKMVSLSVTGRNLWIYAPHFTGGDPEVSSFGASNGSQGIYSFSTPTSRSYDFNLKFTL
ncbi:SusC/RagA family TonB-linked outer membrane protein [Mucilaginibacter sp. KACC 22063]|uniref:SusC/RagA family TonB-linked outer membrane protein n=1 Tax=Mucilaginibacter sp. KACC 22063 TaxID=3025666 RepID=UPI002365F583|nr:SusC/RagA family TonB-linked outer membrane protein [Mucilaginibacter sp. KACC 22063]WDF57427.1 SusC/RagA family TonB-linked outer membrane protein [Mucilaginibacter sp. KACC 22063]